MTPQSASAGRARPAGRGPKIRAAVLAATLAELTETGYAALTVDNVPVIQEARLEDYSPELWALSARSNCCA